MVAGRPYYHAYPADFFMATQGYDLEVKGAYRLIIDLLNERDRPVPDDPKFIAGVLGCSIQKWRKIRERLMFEGKLMHSEDGLHLTNPRFEREHMSRADVRAAAQMNGHLGGTERARRAGQTDMQFDAAPYTGARARTEPQESSKKVATKLKQSSNKVASSSKVIEPETPENSDLAQAPPSLPYARDSSETIVQEDSSLTNSITNPRDESRLANADLYTLYEACIEAAGFTPIQPAHIDRALSQVEKWQKLGIDFDLVVLPSIRAVVLATDEPTRALSRFTARIAHEHAKAKAAAKTKGVYRPPEVPRLSPEGEDPMFLPLRTDLLEKLGDQSYSLTFNHVTFSDAGGGKLRLHGDDWRTEPIRHGRFRAILLAAARPHGFESIW